MNIDQLNEKLLNYQLIYVVGIPKEVKEQANLAEDDPYCTDLTIKCRGANRRIF